MPKIKPWSEKTIKERVELSIVMIEKDIELIKAQSHAYYKTIDVFKMQETVTMLQRILDGGISHED